MMDVSLLENSISEYKSQLTEIQNLLSQADPLTKLELYDLEKDLMELIKMAEDELLSLKKKNLLAMLSESSGSTDDISKSNETTNSEEELLALKKKNLLALLTEDSGSTVNDISYCNETSKKKQVKKKKKKKSETSNSAVISVERQSISYSNERTDSAVISDEGQSISYYNERTDSAVISDEGQSISYSNERNNSVVISDEGQSISYSNEAANSVVISDEGQSSIMSSVNATHKTVRETTTPSLIDEEQLDFVGLKCRVKYTQSWGSFQYHNAMILNYDMNDDTSDDDDDHVKVRVLFLNPIHISMVPCKYFLNGTCTYDDSCKFSHGYVVNMEDLVEYEEPDFTDLSKGSKCITKFEEDGVWYPSTVIEVHEDQVTVSFDTYDEILMVDFHSIVPLPSYLSSDSSSDEDESDTNDDSTIDGEEKSYKPVLMSGPIGDWEQFTKGIGSKLMMKMGYIFGKGLGKYSQGKIDPVEIRRLPPGKSLDHIAELREKGLIKDPTKKKIIKDKSTTVQKGTPGFTFEIINKLTHTDSGIGNVNEYDANSCKFSIEDSYKSLKKQLKNRRGNNKSRTTEKDSKLNLEMFKISEKMISLKKNLNSQKASLARNTGDAVVSLRIQKNIASIENEIDELKKVDNSLENKLQQKNQSKKLIIF